ncbi:hypothetical protein RvY_18659 [Ramazzottius varieornatus]|uniref:Uncharacterized protein n=1 Tax=Ramazzottius varieornatus TaxID=947166 RepID=A0A1D1W6L4_RAMVA|nr:hypothetical protein RvY_18659 [Ramazzottius varieornatus]
MEAELTTGNMGIERSAGRLACRREPIPQFSGQDPSQLTANQHRHVSALKIRAIYGTLFQSYGHKEPWNVIPHNKELTNWYDDASVARQFRLSMCTTDNNARIGSRPSTVDDYGETGLIKNICTVGTCNALERAHDPFFQYLSTCKAWLRCAYVFYPDDNIERRQLQEPEESNDCRALSNQARLFFALNESQLV